MTITTFKEIFDKMIDKHNNIVDLIDANKIIPDEIMNLYNSLIFQIGNDYNIKYKSSIYKDINFINNTSITFENFCKYYDYKTNSNKSIDKHILENHQKNFISSYNNLINSFEYYIFMKIVNTLLIAISLSVFIFVSAIIMKVNL